MRKTEDHDEAVNQRVKRLLQRFSQNTLSRTFGAWREVAEFERSVQKLEAVLEPCGDAWDQPPHQRTASALPAVLALLQKLPYFAVLCAEAALFVSAHAKLQILSDVSEMPCDEADNQRLYAVLCGQVTLIHGDASQPQLQQLLQAAKQQIDNNQTATITTASAAGTASAVGSSNAALDGVTSAPGSSSRPQARSVGIWQQVREYVSAGQKRRIHSSLQGQIATSATGSSSSMQVHQLQAGITAAEAGIGSAVLDVGSLVSSVTVQTVKVGVTFCGHLFPSAPPTAFTAAAGYSTEDAPQLSQLPNSCLAAVAQPNTVAALLVLSKAAYMEAMRLHHEEHVCRLVDMACRIPSLRHTPIKELHRLAAHMKEATYEPGQVILRQGKEVTDVHFLTSGTVQLTYLPPATSQQPHPTLMVLGTRGPGSVLGDDAMRERKIAVGVIAVTSTAVLKVAPQKLLSYLDPLTLRLFGRLRQQQPPKQQMLIQAALTDTREQPPQHSPQHQLRTVVLDQVYESAPMPPTVVRPGDTGYEKLQGQATDSQKPPWHSVKREDKATTTSKDAVAPICSPGHGSHKGLADTGKASHVPGPGVEAGNQTVATSGAKFGGSYAAGHVCGPEDNARWQGELPKGLTLEKCAGLPQTASVMQLIGLIRDTEELRKLRSDSPTQSATADMPNKQSESRSGSLTCDVAADAMSGSMHTELLESSGVAVLQLRIPPGQAPVSGAALAGALDDVAAAWAAVTYDEGLQLIRWTACRWIMLAELEPGASKRSGLEGLAGAVLSAAVRLPGVMKRSVDVLPVVTLSAGVASGSCFVQREAGNFVFSISGRAFDAAEQLCAKAEATPAAALPQIRRDSSHSTVLTTDGVAAVLQTNFWLEPCGGGSWLISARPSMPPTHGHRPASPPGFGAPTSPSRTTLGPGRNTIIGMSGSLLNPTTPKTPGGGLLLPNWGKAQNERRQMRRKIEALQDLFTGAGDSLPPPPEYMLSQPPPVTRSRPRSGTTSHPANSVGGALGGTSPARTVNFLEGAVVSSSGGGSNDSSTSGSGGKKGFKPRLTISVDGDAAAAAAGGAAGTPKAGSSSKTPGSKTPKTARSATQGAQGDNPHALLTPALVMESPIWRKQQQLQQGPAGSRCQQAGFAHTNKSAAFSISSTPGSVDSGSGSRQSAAGQALGPRQRVKQQVWQEVQQMRANSDEIPPSPTAEHPARPVPLAAKGTMHAGHSSMIDHAQPGQLVSNISGAGMWGRSDPSASGHIISSTSPSRTATSLAGAGFKDLRASAPGLPVSNFSGTGSLRHAALNRPRSAEPMMISEGGKSANGGNSTYGGRSKTTLQEPQHTRNSRLTSSMWGGGGTGGGSGVGSHGGGGENAQLRRPEQHAVEFSDNGIVGSSKDGRAARSTAGAAHLQVGLASKQSMLKSSQGGFTHLHPKNSNTGWSQQQQQQEGMPDSQQVPQSESSKPESLNSMSLSTVHTAVGEAAAAARLEQQRQQALVMSACKGLGSYAAAEAYVAALPEGLMTVNLSAAGLSRLPPLTRLDQLEYLSASFNKLDSLPPLIPSNAAAVAAASAAAADAGCSSSSNTSSTGQSTDFFAGSTDGKDNTGSVTSSSSSSSILDKMKQQLVSGRVSSLPATLSRLGLAYNRLEHIPMELPAAVPQLTELDLSHNRLTELPATFGVLTSLKLLFLSHNQLVRLPGSFTRLYSLQTLDLSHNKLVQLPEDLQQIPGLVSLHLQHNQIQRLPPGFSQLSGLKCLGLGYNPKLTALPQGLLIGLSGLSTLDLAGCGLTDAQLAAAAAAAGADQQSIIEEVLSNATHQEQQPQQQQQQQQQQSFLTEVVVAAPSAMLSPQNAASLAAPRSNILPELEVLDLSYNLLQQQPQWLPSSLKRLSANNNKITKLSEGLCCKLGDLVVLDLHGNRLLEVPKELMLMENIQILALAGNPGLDAEVVGSGKSDRHGTGSPEKSERSGHVSEMSSRRPGVNSARISKAEKSKEMGESGMGWVYQWLAQRKAAAAAALMRGVHQQRQQKQEQVAGSLMNHSAGLLPGIRQTVIMESGRIL